VSFHASYFNKKNSIKKLHIVATLVHENPSDKILFEAGHITFPSKTFCGVLFDLLLNIIDAE
jgi:hypothetical protein